MSDPQASPAPDCLVVGIGASAGGIQAIRRFFQHLPPDSGIAFVVILHLAPDFESRLADVLQLSSPIPVTQVDNLVDVVPNHVYVIPPDKSLTIVHGQLVLSPRLSIEERRAPVDIFLRTLADARERHAVAVILSGTGANGSMGLKRIKEKGGLSLVQSPDEAEFNEMPLHSIETGLVDQVLPVAGMPAAIIAYRDGLERVRLPPLRQAQSDVDAAALRDIFTELRVRTGHDFSNYKRATVFRRLARRMSLHRLSQIAEYAALLRTQPEESAHLLKDLLISVTNFFRDREAFQKLETAIVPKLFAGKGEDDHVRVWVAGCATGEEAYSVAMLLAERAMTLASPPSIQVFATDIDEAAVAMAREGLYTLNDAADVSPERLRRFFTKDRERYRVRKELRDLILFAHHNILKDPPFSHLDLLCCRNLLIYLNRTAQRRAMEVMHFALNPGGDLMLGSSESIEGAGDLFVVVDKEASLFESRAVAAKVALPLPDLTLPALAERSAIGELRTEPQVRERLSALDLHQRLLELFAPPSIVVNADYQIVHLSEHAGRFLQHSGGEPSNDVLKVIRPELRIELRTALYQSSQQRSHVEAPEVPVRLDSGTVAVRVLVRPVLKDDEAARGFFVILFQESAEGTTAAEPVVPLAHGDAAHQLEEEVIRVRGQLRATIERHETQAEELKASNEELQAMNEELRSSAEELETSREELESANEELRTVNQELKVKVEEQIRSNDDIYNLINSTEIGAIFLDRASRIKLFTPSARDLFTLIPADRGRPLSDISTVLVKVDVHAEIQRVLDRLERVEREVRTRAGRWYLMRVLPYRTSDERIDGVVLTFVDISARRIAEQSLRASEERLRRAMDIDTVGVAFYDVEGLITEANEAFLRMNGFSASDVAERRLHREKSARTIPVPPTVLPQTGDITTYEREFTRRDGTRWWALCSSAGVTPRESVEFVIDITSRHEAEEQLRSSETRSRMLIDSVSDYAIFTMDTAGRIDRWNPGATRLFGYLDQDVIGKPSSILFTPEDRALGVPEAERLHAGERGHAPDERWHLRSDGTRFFASGVVSPLRDEGGAPIGFVKVARDLTERKQWEDALQQAHAALEARVADRTAELAAANRALDTELTERRQAEAQVRGLMRRLLSVQEDERRRIARDLHDHLGQQVAALSLGVEAVLQSADGNARLRAAANDIRATISKLDRDLDFVTWELRPATLDDFGLVVTLRDFVREWSKEFGIAAQFHAGALGDVNLPRDAEINLYRIAQEALNNTYKHAAATQVDVILERRDQDLVLVLEDNGHGFAPKAESASGNGGLGLVGMHERAAFIGGTLELESGASGTTVFVRIPLTPSDAPGTVDVD